MGSLTSTETPHDPGDRVSGTHRATDLFRKKVPLNAIQRLAGHENLITTIRYIGLPLDHLDELVDEAFDDDTLTDLDDPNETDAEHEEGEQAA